MKTRLKRFLPLWIAAILLGVLVLAVSAATPSLTFTNEKDNKLTLSVTKAVTSTSDAEIPDEEFTFKILRDGEVDDKLTYQLYDADGEEWVQVYYQDDNGNRVEADGKAITEPLLIEKDAVNTSKKYITVSFEPGSKGQFTLKAGWKAVFSSNNMRIGTVYTVTEVTDSVDSNGNKIVLSQANEDNYYLPKVAEIPVTLQSDSAKNLAEFTNQYIAPDGTFKVSKSIITATGYGSPTDKEFTYRLQIGGTDYANQEYTLYQTSDNKVLGTYKTNAKGEFTLKGDQYAQFEKVKLNKSYTLYEYESSGWWCVGGTTGSEKGITYAEKRTGTTSKKGNEEHFTNRNASFVVQKSVATGQDAGDMAFQFILRDATGKPWANQSYYIYDSSKKTDGKVYTTDQNGGFTLHANEAAMFLKIEEGTGYSVEEVSSPLYELVAPKEGKYTKEVAAAVESLPFTNNILENQGLYVSKLANNEPQVATYTMKLVKVSKDSSGTETGETAIAANAVDSDGNAITFDEAGTFGLQSGKSAHFTKLTDGEYRVYEYNLDKKVIASAVYTAADSSMTSDMAFTINDSSGSRTAKLTKTFTVDADQIQQIAVTNDYTSEMFRISKTILDYKGSALDENGDGSSLSDISGGDTSQRFVYRIDKYNSREDWENKGTPLSTTYTDFNCDETGNGSVLVQGSGDGWYVITELDTWSNTDYNYKSEDYQGITPSNEKYTTHGSKYVAFELESVYDAYNLPTAHFVNEESPYAYRSGQAYAENQMKQG